MQNLPTTPQLTRWRSLSLPTNLHQVDLNPAIAAYQEEVRQPPPPCISTRPRPPSMHKIQEAQTPRLRASCSVFNSLDSKPTLPLEVSSRPATESACKPKYLGYYVSTPSTAFNLATPIIIPYENNLNRHPHTTFNSLYAPTTFYALGNSNEDAHDCNPIVNSSYRGQKIHRHSQGDDKWEEGECYDVMLYEDTVYSGDENPDSWSSFRGSSHGLDDSTLVSAQFPRTYLHPDDARQTCTLIEFVRSVDPVRLNAALFGPCLDIIEEETGQMLFHRAMKRLLFLFCGRESIEKFIHPTERKDADGIFYKAEEIRVPRASTGYIGLKVLMGWFQRAGKKEYMSTMLPIHVPENLFAAISLARTMTLFGLHRDARRVDRIVDRILCSRAIFASEVQTVWNLLPKDSRYTWRIVERVATQVEHYEMGFKKALPQPDQMFELLQKYPQLGKRVESRMGNKNLKSLLRRDLKEKPESECEKNPLVKEIVCHEVSQATPGKMARVLRIVMPRKDNSRNDVEPSSGKV